jgi:hypothetical protein
MLRTLSSCSCFSICRQLDLASASTHQSVFEPGSLSTALPTYRKHRGCMHCNMYTCATSIPKSILQGSEHGEKDNMMQQQHETPHSQLDKA